jgi:tryptophan-rich sensory protein
MKIQWKPLIISIVIPLAVGGLSTLITQGSMKDFERVKQPPFAPPGWLFPIVWSILFVLTWALHLISSIPLRLPASEFEGYVKRSSQFGDSTK